MKKFIKTLLTIIVIIFIVIQFFRPKKDTTSHPADMAIAGMMEVPDNVMQTLRASCYDCHSDEPSYPWYWHVQPGRWILLKHMKDGKRHLNFSAFGSYELRRQYKKLDEIREEIEEGEMPLKSYLWMHGSAHLSEAQKQDIYNWVAQSRQQMEAKYPADSLRRR